MTALGNLLLETKTGCYAWALLPNHTHFLLRTGEVPVATVMSPARVGYAVQRGEVTVRERRYQLTP